MAGIFKKAMGLFVEFEADKPTTNPPLTVHSPRTRTDEGQKPPGGVSENFPARTGLDAEALDKFEKHFETLFDQANMPGPDYYEFWKMMETLEAHIRDERARISATYASLAIQGLTKEQLIATAEKYKVLIVDDKSSFEKAAREKGEGDISHKQRQLEQLEETVAQHTETIRKLTQEITESQTAMRTLQDSIAEEQKKLEHNKQGYTLACDAMLQKISDDINKIKTTL